MHSLIKLTRSFAHGRDAYAGRWITVRGCPTFSTHSFRIIEPTVIMSAIVTHTAQEVPVTTIHARSIQTNETSHRIATIEKVPIMSTSISSLSTFRHPTLSLHVDPRTAALSHKNPQKETKDLLALLITQKGVAAFQGSAGSIDVALSPTRNEDGPSAGKSFVLAISSGVSELIMLYAGSIFTQPLITQKASLNLFCEHLTSSVWRKSDSPFTVAIN